MFRFLMPMVLAAAAVQTAGSTLHPHILLILADDLGWKDVGFHGSEIKTPHLDALAAAGTQLNYFYVQPLCTPTRASLMTGRYPIRYGLQTNVLLPGHRYGLDLRERTLAQALKEAGYETAIVGKWHLGMYEWPYLPTRRGFDHQYGHYNGSTDYFTHERFGGLDWHRDDKPLREEGYSTDLIAQEAIRLVNQHDLRQPLFLYVAFNAVHVPLQAPPGALEQYRQIESEKRRQHAAMTTCMDTAIGRIIDAFDKRAMRKDTLIFFCSDNGAVPLKDGGDNAPLRGAKFTLYEGGVRVPALAVWPGHLKAGAVVDEPLHMVDCYPTLLKLAGAKLEQPLGLDGLDAWPVMAQGKPTPHAEILHNVDAHGGAIRVGDWKLIQQKVPNHRDRIELFNIHDDPSEKDNLAARHPEKVKELKARLAFYAGQARPALWDLNPLSATTRPTPAVWGPGGPPVAND